MAFPSPSGSMCGPTPFPRSISHRLGLAVIASLLLFVAAGSVSSYLAWSILSIAQGIPAQSHHVEITEEIQANVHHLISEIHRAVIHGSLDRESHVQDLAARTRAMISTFLVGHLSEQAVFPEREGEITLMRRLDALYAEVGHSATAILDRIRAGAAAEPDTLAVLDRAAQELPELTGGLNDIHQAKIGRLVGAGVHRMKLLLGALTALLVTGGLCGLAGIRVFSRTVSVPLRRLASAAQDIARGQFTSRVAATSPDEIGWLAQSFNEMTQALQRREAELRQSQAALERRVDETHALCRIGVEVSSKLDIEAVLESVVEQARALLRCQAGALCLFPSAAVVEPWARDAQGNGVRCLGKGASPPGPDWMSRSSCATLEREGPVVCLRAPLRHGDDVLGILCVGRTETVAFESEDRALLEGLAAQAAIAVENARLYREVGSLATVQERERIAREIHDGVAQAVAFLHLRLKTLEDRLARGGEPPSPTELADMRTVSKRAYVDLRQSVFGLRTGPAPGMGLLPGLTEYLGEFSRQTGIQVEIQDGNPRATDFSPDAEVQLVRVIQEALNNVRKHARARRAWVRFAVDDEDMGRVTVEDDGIGFPVASGRDATGQRFGLRTMQERAESVGGRLEILSGPWQGTRIVIRMPLAKAGSTL